MWVKLPRGQGLDPVWINTDHAVAVEVLEVETWVLLASGDRFVTTLSLEDALHLVKFGSV